MRSKRKEVNLKELAKLCSKVKTNDDDKMKTVWKTSPEILEYHLHVLKFQTDNQRTGERR